MSKRCLMLVFSLMVALAMVAGTAGAAPGKTPLVKVIVLFDRPLGLGGERMIAGVGGKVANSFHAIPAVAATIPQWAVTNLLRNPRVISVEVDGVVSATAETLPWGVDRIDAEVVHAYNKGTGIKVAVLDTGIDLDHPDLAVAGNVSMISGISSGDDDNGHGTHVAGTIAALDNDIGVIGVAPEVQLYAVKVLDSSGSGTWSAVIAGIQWAIDNGMQVINMSLGGSGGSAALKTACDNAYAAGIVVVAAAGNKGTYSGSGDTVLYPARYDSVIAVAATTSSSSNRRASYSSTGPTVELAAPGDNIYSTLRGGSYGNKSGTSMASPHVAGVAALVIASGIQDSNSNGRVNDEVRLRLQQTADDLGTAGKDNLYGYGLVDADEAAPKPTNREPVANAGTDKTVNDSDGTGKETVTLDGSSSYDPDGSIVSWQWSEGATSLGTGKTLPYDFAVGTHMVTLKVTDDKGATDTDDVVVKVNANRPPVANAGPDQTVSDANGNNKENVTLNGSASSDPDGSIASWEWKEGSTVLSTKKTFSDDFAVGTHTVTLKITDNGGATDTDDVVITVNANSPPVADAGPDQTVSDADGDGLQTATLDGSASYDLDGSVASWEWSEGPTVLGSGETLPCEFAIGSHTVTLKATDDVGLVDTDQVVIKVNPNQYPIANAGSDKTVGDGDNNGLESVTLDGSASYDPDGTIESWEWSKEGSVLGNGPTLTVVDLPLGIYTFTLMVTDDAGLTDTDDITVTVVANQSPSANAGPDQTVGDPDGNGWQSVTLNGSGSSDPDGSIVSWQWSEGATSLGTGKTLSHSFAVGTHTVTLTVTDNGGATDTDEVLITVNANKAPIANAGANQTVTDADRNGSETVTLNGSASSDPDGSIVSWEWFEAATSLGTGKTLSHSFAVGTHTVTLKVTDNGGATSTDDVVITVNQPAQPAMRVASIQMTLVRQYLGFVTYATATVNVVDGNGGVVQGAVVSGHWEMATSDVDSGSTSSSGLVIFTSDTLRYPASGTLFVFVVDSIAKDGWIWDAAGSVTTGQIAMP